MSIPDDPTNPSRDWFADGQDPAAYDPIRAARGVMKPSLPKRFYQTVSLGEAEGLAVVLLDGRPTRTKGRALLGHADPTITRLLVTEWAGQAEEINPATMPATRIVHAAIDHVAANKEAVREDILRYAASDLVCYRADEPAALVERQHALWDPVLAHMGARYGAAFHVTTGILHVQQPETALDALQPALSAFDDSVALAALHVLTSVSGSALIALTVADGIMDAAAGFEAGECDTDYEIAIWGRDEEAMERRAMRLAEFSAAAKLCVLAR
jgi:chaperone required for assembly of F1-ATPase